MAIVGVIAVVLVALAVLLVAAVGLRSIPDVRRYLRIRHM
ncbi:DUF6893 family small protein [Nocardia niigatensis]